MLYKLTENIGLSLNKTPPMQSKYVLIVQLSYVANIFLNE